jgi:NAD(P)-dependent dehydrogenase (short-subunit alcohol dehydrogenase family)
VVTGGAGAIGAAVMRRFAAEGDRALGLDVKAGPGVVVCDVSDEDHVHRAMAEVRERHGPVEVLVHAAGITGAGGIEDEGPATWRLPLCPRGGR